MNKLKYPSVLCFELNEFSSLITVADISNVSQQSIKDTKAQYFKDDNRLMIDFNSQNFYTTLTFSKKAYLDTQIVDQTLDLVELTYDVIVTYECDKGAYKEIIPSEDIEKYLQGTQKELILDLELKDEAQVPYFKLQLKVTSSHYTIEQSLMPGFVKQSSATDYLMNFTDVQIANPERIRRSQPDTEIKKTEVFLIVELEKQKVEFNVDEPKGTDKKNPSNQFQLYKNGQILRLTLEERVYKLERDEQAFLQSIRNINTKQTTSINKFLISRTGGFGADQTLPDFNSIVNRKKIFESKKELITKEISIEHDLIQHDSYFSVPQNFSFTFQDGVIVQGVFTLNVNKFVNMPRGKLNFEIMDYTCFKKDQNIEYQDLVLRASQQIDQEGDRITYLMKESQFLTKQEHQSDLLFDTYYYDDTIKLEMFHKNSIIKSNNLGKGTLKLGELAYDSTSIIPIYISNKTLQKCIGILYVKLVYTPINEALLADEWVIDIQTSRQVDKYLYFDECLMNPFKNNCSFGYLQVNLSKAYIPESASNQPGNNGVQSQNELYLLKLKVGSESNQLLLAAPNKIINYNNQKFFAKTVSIHDKMSVEFYHIRSDKPIDPNAKFDFQNMRLLAHEQILIRNLPFGIVDKQIQTQNYSLLMPIQNSGSAAIFDIDVHYQPQIEESWIQLPIDNKHGGFLFMKMLQSENFANHHHKDLDKFSFTLDIINETKKLQVTKKLYFNKPQLPLGFIEMALNDQILFNFSVTKGGSNEREDIASYTYSVIKEGLKGAIINGEYELIELSTWQPLQKPFNLNYTHEGSSTAFQLGKSTLAQQLTQGQQTGMQTTNMNVFKSSVKSKGFHTMTTIGRGTVQDQTSKFLIESVMMEFEYRENYLTLLNAQKRTDTSLVNLYLEKENIVDLLISQDMSDHSQFEISNVSSDKRCLRDNHTFYINAHSFDDPLTMRIYTINDVIQLRIKGVHDVFVTFKLAELPIFDHNSLISYFQVGSKQMKVKLELTQDPDLIPKDEQQAAGGGLFSKMMKGVETGVKNIVQAEKETNAYMQKLNDLGGKGAAEQIRLLKQYVNDQEMQNKQLITKQLRLKKEYDKTQKKLLEAQQAKPKAAEPNVASKDPQISEINKVLSGTLYTKVDQAQNKNPNTQQTQLKICACGQVNPKFKGYCAECVTKLKTAFDHYLEKFKKISEEYDSYTGIDQKKADEKLRLMKNKIEQYEIKLNERELIDVMEKHSTLAQSEDNRNFAEFKVTVQSMRQEQEIMKVKQDIELQDLKKQQDYLEMMVAKKQGTKRDVEREIQNLEDVVEELQGQMDTIDKRVVLKKRYVLQQTKRSI